MYFESIFIGHTDNQTQAQTQPLMDTHQLSYPNFNYMIHIQMENILLKCILSIFSLDTRKTGHTNTHNF